MELGRVAAKRSGTMALAGLIAAAASVLVAFSTPAEAARRRARSADVYAPPYAAMVVDAKTGRTLHAENEDALRHPASVTKVMTLYLLFEQLEKGKLSLDTPLHVSANASRQAPSKLGLRPGQTIEVEDAIKALVTKSANDVAVVVAENLAGSEEEFAEQMTRKARALGMNRTVYRNASGLPDPEQVTTARDLTVLGRAIQDRFPRYYRYFQTRVFHYADRSHANHNKLLGRIEGVDGIKTGFTRASGFNLLTNVKTGDRHIVAVVLGGRSGPSRDRIMANLVQSNLPRAYAGTRTEPNVAEAPERTQVAAAEPVRGVRAAEPAVETTAATTPAPTRPAGKPLDISSLRPVVASASGASTTTTPSSSTLRWNTGPQGLPQSAQAYAPVQEAPAAVAVHTPTATQTPRASIAPKVEERSSVSKAEEPRRETRPAVTGWIIQLGATDDEQKAKSILEKARSRSGRALAKASPFTEKVTRDGTTLYRARFSGFAEADDAEGACKVLKRSGFACFAARS